MDQTIVVLPCSADRIDDNTWQAEVVACQEPAFTGLFGLGASFNDARKALATAVRAVIDAGQVPDVDPSDVVGIRLMCMTRKTFAYDDLTDTL
ncbi:MAG TPA: hypothetical protein VHD87_15650 [Acidimicrobiales bacterium]|nr:hypothetical protein [Acidimicrobiales bacterium]